MNRRGRARVARVSALVWLSVSLLFAACIQDAVESGPIGGPSELGLSLGLTASPDLLPLDGTAQALIGILARNAGGESVADLRLSLQIASSRGFEDFGRLSARQVVTGPDGRAGVTYTAPTSSLGTGAIADTGEIVTIWVTPVGTDFNNAVSRALTIRLVPPNGVLPGFDATAGFGFAPDPPRVFDTVLFTTECPDEASLDCVRDPSEVVATYRWDFGDGQTGSGASTSHSYQRAGSYSVTLTIGDVHGRSADKTRSVAVSGGTPPTAVLSVSPTDPRERDRVFFNASGSTAAPGRTVASYAWDFGDGNRATGVTTAHAYHVEGTYVVTLNVTDDRGQVGTATGTVKVAATGPDAQFVFSPTDPSEGQTVFFDASGSDPGPGRTIVSYRWNFGDGSASSTGPKTNHKYRNDGTFEAQLKVTNNVGESDTISREIVVSP